MTKGNMGVGRRTMRNSLNISMRDAPGAFWDLTRCTMYSLWLSYFLCLAALQNLLQFFKMLSSVCVDVFFWGFWLNSCDWFHEMHNKMSMSRMNPDCKWCCCPLTPRNTNVQWTSLPCMSPVSLDWWHPFLDARCISMQCVAPFVWNCT
jgi:hypothetical protein